MAKTDPPSSTEPIENVDAMDTGSDDEDEVDDNDYDLCPTFCAADIPEDALNFVLETVSHGFGFDFKDVFCDQCTEVIFGRFYHCDLCNDGDFDLCMDCKEKGKHCDVADHELEECGVDIEDAEVDEAIRSDAGNDDAMEITKDNAGKKDTEGEDEDWEDDDSDDGLDGESPLYVVTSLEPDVSEIKLRSRAPMDKFDTPFKGWSAEKLYDFWKAKLRRPQDEVSATNLSAFTFVILDEETVKSYESCGSQSSAPKKTNTDDSDDDLEEDLELINEKLEKTTVLVCTDAPDFGEGESEVKLKTVRMSLADAATAIIAFEVLAVCPSEFGKEEALSVMPPPTFDMEDIEGDSVQAKLETLGGFAGLVSKPATPIKARENKRKAIMEAEAST